MSYESKSVFCCLLVQRYSNYMVYTNTFSERPFFHYEWRGVGVRGWWTGG
jgi:hypothetical protein